MHDHLDPSFSPDSSTPPLFSTFSSFRSTLFHRTTRSDPIHDGSTLPVPRAGTPDLPCRDFLHMVFYGLRRDTERRAAYTNG